MARDRNLTWSDCGGHRGRVEINDELVRIRLEANRADGSPVASVTHVVDVDGLDRVIATLQAARAALGGASADTPTLVASTAEALSRRIGDELVSYRRSRDRFDAGDDLTPAEISKLTRYSKRRVAELLAMAGAEPVGRGYRDAPAYAADDIARVFNLNRHEDDPR